MLVLAEEVAAGMLYWVQKKACPEYTQTRLFCDLQMDIQSLHVDYLPRVRSKLILCFAYKLLVLNINLLLPGLLSGLTRRQMEEQAAAFFLYIYMIYQWLNAFAPLKGFGKQTLPSFFWAKFVMAHCDNPWFWRT